MAEKQGRFVILDTTLAKTDATLIDELSGRQGDNGRIVYFALKDGDMPHNLDRQDVQLSVKDAAGKIKVLTGIYDMVSATAGLFSMLIPAEFYQAAGDVEEAYLAVIDDKNMVISSIPITFTVFANGIILSANASQDFISSVKKAVDEAYSLVNGLNDSITAQTAAYNTLKDSLQTIIGQINSNQVALKTGSNKFTEANEFDDQVTFNDEVITHKPITGSFKSQELSDKTDLLTLLEPGMHYIVRNNESARSMLNKPADVLYAFSLDTIDIAGYLLNSWATTMLRLTENVTGAVYTTVLSRDNKGVIKTYAKWHKQGDGTRFFTTVNLNGVKAYLTRIGNLVSITMHAFKTEQNTKYAGDYETWAEAGAIPVGYRPTALVRVNAGRSGGLNASGAEVEAREGNLAIDIDGSIMTRQFDMAVGKADQTSWFDASGTYMTIDDFPTN